jgi:hypothetical protein
VIGLWISLGYTLSTIVAGRIVYTKVQNYDWFAHETMSDRTALTFFSSIFWPAALVIWGIHWFVTGGVKK